MTRVFIALLLLLSQVASAGSYWTLPDEMRGNSEFTGNITVPATGLLFKTNGTLIKSGTGALTLATGANAVSMTWGAASALTMPTGTVTVAALQTAQTFTAAQSFGVRATFVAGGSTAAASIFHSASNKIFVNGGSAGGVLGDDSGNGIITWDATTTAINKPLTLTGGFAAQTIAGAVTWSGAQTINSTLTVKGDGTNNGLVVSSANAVTLVADNSSQELTIRGGGARMINTTEPTDKPKQLLLRARNSGTSTITSTHFSSAIVMQNLDNTSGNFATIFGNNANGQAGPLMSFIYVDHDNLAPKMAWSITTRNSGSFNQAIYAAETGAVTLGPSAGGVNHTVNGGLLLPSSGATASALNFYATTTFTFAWTPNGSGSTASSNVTAVLTRIGNLVSLTIPASADAVPAGTTEYLSYSSLPAWARPSTTRSAGGAFPVRDNSTYAYTGTIEVNSSGVVYLFRDQASTAFTNAAGAGAPRVSLTWLI